mgnify:CR=1 FL=1
MPLFSQIFQVLGSIRVNTSPAITGAQAGSVRADRSVLLVYAVSGYDSFQSVRVVAVDTEAVRTDTVAVEDTLCVPAGVYEQNRDYDAEDAKEDH